MISDRDLAHGEGVRGVDVLAGEVDHAVGGGQLDVDFRMRLQEIAKPRHQPAGGEGDRQAERQYAAVTARLDLLHRLRQSIEAVADARPQGLAGIGQEKAAGEAAEQRLAQLILQELHLMADRGLGDAELGGGAREAQMAGRGLEGAER